MFKMRLEIDLGWFGAKLTPSLYTSWHFFVAYFENFRHLISPAGVDSAPETRSWMANWRDQKKMGILRVADRSVTLLEEPRRKSFEKYRKSCDFRDFWWVFSNLGGGRSGCGPEVSTYILFGSISMSSVRFLKNLAWSRGLRWLLCKSTAPDQGCRRAATCVSPLSNPGLDFRASKAIPTCRATSK